MLSTELTALLLVAIFNVSFADQLQMRQNQTYQTSRSWYDQNPDFNSINNSIDATPQNGQNFDYQNSVANKVQNNTSSYTQNLISKSFSEKKTLEPVKHFGEFYNQYPANFKEKTFMGSMVIQKNNTFNSSPNSTNLYGSITQISNESVPSTKLQELNLVNQQSSSSGGSYPKLPSNVYGAATAQSNTLPLSQHQNSTQQPFTNHRIPSNLIPSQRVLQQPIFIQQINFLRSEILNLRNEARRQATQLNRMETSLASIEQVLKNNNNMIYQLINSRT